MRRMWPPIKGARTLGVLTGVAAISLAIGCGPKFYQADYPPTTIKPTIKAVKLDPVAKEIKISGRIQFETGKALIKQASHTLLDEVVEVMKGNPSIVKVEVQGHTDSKGDPAKNKELSQRRAESVRDYMVSKGISTDRLTATGFGEERPLADNATAEGRRQNRRVEFHIVGDKAMTSPEG